VIDEASEKGRRIGRLRGEGVLFWTGAAVSCSRAAIRAFVRLSRYFACHRLDSRSAKCRRLARRTRSALPSIIYRCRGSGHASASDWNPAFPAVIVARVLSGHLSVPCSLFIGPLAMARNARARDIFCQGDLILGGVVSGESLEPAGGESEAKSNPRLPHLCYRSNGSEEWRAAIERFTK
jgi:hypothetical protein